MNTEGYRSTPPTPCLPPQHATREGWLTAAAGLILEELFPEAAIEPPTRVRVTCALTVSGRNVIGECWHGQCSADGTREITISAVLDQPTDDQGILATLAHELLHAALPEGVGHRGEFAKALPALGLEGPPTSTSASDVLRAWFRWSVLPRLGRFPHASLNPYGVRIEPGSPTDPPSGQPPIRRPRCKPPGQRPQRNRQLLYQCPECGQKIRAAGRDLNALCIGQKDTQAHEAALFVCQAPPAESEPA